MKLKFLILICLFLASCQSQNSGVKEIKGEVFGSYYLVKYTGELETSLFQKELNTFYFEFNNEFSTYHRDSLISLFNAASANKKFSVSTRFIELLEVAKKLHQDTEGAFDPTLAPVIRAWGFGGAQKRSTAPSEKEIKSALELVGFRFIQWDVKTQEIWKTKAGVILDVNAFAPGYAADLIAKKLESHNIHNFMVDISGEFMVKGEKDKGVPWIIGIEKPTASQNSLQAALTLNNEALATSGDYRQFFNDQGKRRSHIIDPRTGHPVTGQIASASVIATSAALADGWGTAMMILGEKGETIAQKAGVKTYLLKAKSTDQFEAIISEDFKKHLLPSR